MLIVSYGTALYLYEVWRCNFLKYGMVQLCMTITTLRTVPSKSNLPFLLFLTKSNQNESNQIQYHYQYIKTTTNHGQ